MFALIAWKRITDLKLRINRMVVLEFIGDLVTGLAIIALLYVAVIGALIIGERK